MLRTILLYLSKAPWARRIITGWRFARRAASRFIAGDTLDEAIATVQALNQKGLLVSLDHLGEAVTNAEESKRAADDYMVLMDRICQTGVKAYASLKLTQLGLAVDYDLCLANLRRVVARARECGLFIRIDMEDSTTVDRALSIYRTLRAEGLAQVGPVIQAYLFRSVEDMRGLLAQGARIRLCKGAYQEPASVAFPRKADVDAQYDVLAKMMIDAAKAAGSQPVSADGRIPPPVGIATHDEKRIAFARQYADQIGFPRPALEFQMLNGIRTDLQVALAKEGYPVRVYVPYGTQWYPYFMRRLAERPANVWFFLSNFLRG
jgi:proline dehydrogenase